jgi:hypothetical protein
MGKAEKIRLHKNKFNKSLEKNSSFLLDRFTQEWGEFQKKEITRKRIQKIQSIGGKAAKLVLGLLAVTGALTIALVAPQVFVLFDKAGRRMFISRKDFNYARRDLQRQRCIIPLDASGRLIISKKGRERALRNMYNNLQIHKTDAWDGLWRVVAFDIPERKKDERDDFREELKRLDMLQVQKSLFVSPYPCEQELQFLISVFYIDAYVCFFTTDALYPDKKAKEYFEIS